MGTRGIAWLQAGPSTSSCDPCSTVLRFSSFPTRPTFPLQAACFPRPCPSLPHFEMPPSSIESAFFPGDLELPPHLTARFPEKPSLLWG